jgi:lipocalin-like protein
MNSCRDSGIGILLRHWLAPASGSQKANPKSTKLSQIAIRQGPPTVNDDPADSGNKPGFGVEALPWSASKSHNRWDNSICAEREPNGPGGEGNEPGRAGISRGAESLVEVIDQSASDYFGTYSVDSVQHTVTHYVRGSSSPNPVGSDQLRSYKFENDLLLLSAPPNSLRGTSLELVLVCERVP